MTTILSHQNILGRQPDILPEPLRRFGDMANQGDMNAVFELSRAFYNQKDKVEDLDAALYYKSLLVENFPEERDPYSCAVTLLEIALIFAEKADMEASKHWFQKTYQYVKVNYMPHRRLYLLTEIDFFEAVVESGLSMAKVINSRHNT